MVQLRWGATTNPGLVRAENEDTFVAEPMVFAVADGMGGHQAGEVASALAASILRDKLGEGAISEDQAISAVTEANAAIYGAARANSAQSGMGTTLTAIAVLRAQDNAPEQLVLLNVGDSRTYRFRSGRLQRVTVDHSYVQELVATGHITMEEARTHPRRNIVTRALGIEPNVRTDMWTLPIVRGDRFVLCSDGLVDEVPDSEILELVTAVEDPQILSEQLVEMANRHGGRDNVTVVVVDVLDGADPPDPTSEMSFDPTWAEGAPEPAIWAEDDFAPPDAGSTDGLVTPGLVTPGLVTPGLVTPGLEMHASEVTLRDASATPTMPPPAAPLPGVPTLPTSASSTEPASATAAQASPDAEVSTIGAPIAGPTPTLPLAPSQSAIPAAPVTAAPAPPSGPVPRRRKRRLTGGVFLFIVVLAAILTVTFTLIAVHARSGYFVGFEGDRVVVYKGQPGGVLWFDPTVAQISDRTRNELDATLIAVIDQHVTYDSAEQAAAFINEQVIPTTAVTAPATTTTSATTATTLTGETTTTVPTGG